MLTAHKIKIIQSLDKKKFRQKYNLFLVESNKIIQELSNANVKVLDIYSKDPSLLSFNDVAITEISDQDLKKISFLQHPKDSVALCQLQDSVVANMDGIQLILDGIQDPGNLGTIIRLADWFGIQQIVCSEDTVDVFNPKVIQASMGSFLRVNVVYTSLVPYLESYPHPILGTDMQGENIYKKDFPSQFSLVLGNEGNGMREEVERCLTEVVSIPRFGQNKATESLNVSMATGIILGQIFSEK
ncbi:TrmH family RNA methyltransferase [Chryseobacterium sp. T1]